MHHLDESIKGNDHEHTRHVSLRAQRSEPSLSLHPRRDSNEDACETLTRKRPRLENLNEPRAVNSMSPSSETTVCSSIQCPTNM